MSTNEKSKVLFEHFIDQMVSWYKEKHEMDDNDLSKMKIIKSIESGGKIIKYLDDNDLSKMKIIKFHFFVCTLSDLLLEKYQFLAMRYGPVCGDLLTAIDEDVFNKFTITSRCLIMKESEGSNTPINEDQESFKIKDAYNEAIRKLKQKNDDLIDYGTFDLVQTSHGWHSWQVAWEIAKDINREAYLIDPERIKDDPLGTYA